MSTMYLSAGLLALIALLVLWLLGHLLLGLVIALVILIAGGGAGFYGRGTR